MSLVSEMSLAQRVLLTWVFTLVFLIMLVLKLDGKVIFIVLLVTSVVKNGLLSDLLYIINLHSSFSSALIFEVSSNFSLNSQLNNCQK